MEFLWKTPIQNEREKLWMRTVQMRWKRLQLSSISGCHFPPRTHGHCLQEILKSQRKYRKNKASVGPLFKI